MKYIKLGIVLFCRGALRFFYILPIKKNRIYLSSNLGQSISCNPYYIYKYMEQKYKGQFEYIWEYRGEKAEVENIVMPGTLKSIYYIMTSKFIISNDGLGSYIPKRKSQIFINTWHGGGAYKKSGTDFITDQHPVDIKINRICGKQTDIFISSCKKFSDVMSKAKLVSRDKFLECGMPRNDFLITGTTKNIEDKVKDYFHIAKKKKIALFAPTYRGEEKKAMFHSELNVDACLKALEKRFGGEWVFLMRKHHFVKNMEFENCINASSYPDMQELLYVADVFITDYSSTIWDYSLTFKPGFLFTPDLKEYGVERSFYTPPESWAFPISETNDELCDAIYNYDENESRKKIMHHHELLGSKEVGNAAETIGKIMISKVKGSN